MKDSLDPEYRILVAAASLALHSRHGPCSVPALAAQAHLTPSYLEKLFKAHLAHRIIKSVRGTSGGYVLAHSPSAITVSAILRAARDTRSRTANTRFTRSKYYVQANSTICVLEELQDAIPSHVTLEDIIAHRAATHPYLQKLLREVSDAPLSSIQEHADEKAQAGSDRTLS